VRLRQASGSFLKKRTKKFLDTAGLGTAITKTRHKQKFFASFFQKRSACLACLALAFPTAAQAHEDPGVVLASIRQALAPTLPAGASVTLGSAAGAGFMPACAAPLAITITGAEPYENATVNCPSPVWTLYVAVTVTAVQAVVVAARPIAVGQPIGPDDLTMRPEPETDFRGQPVYYDPASLAGGVAVVNLPAGAILTSNDIQAPMVVRAGQTVAVDVRSGGVDVSINAVAAQAGRVGDTIMLTNPSSGKRFTALVTASGPVVQLQP
jgi:flagella basal body P-ring formation protein FlgA